MTDKTASAIAAMAAAIVERKDAKAAGLTPVAGEKGRIPDLPTIFMPQEAIEEVVRDIRASAKQLLQVALDIEGSLGKEPPGPSKREQVDTVKQAEREADAKFADEYKAKQLRAQAAAFRDAEPKAAPAKQAVGDGWKCPDHGDEDIELLTSRKGRTYRACGMCEQYEA